MVDAIELASFDAVMIEEVGPNYGDIISTDKHDGGNWTSGKVGIGQFYGSPWGLSAPVCAKEYPGVAAKDITKDMALRVFDQNYYKPIGAAWFQGGLPLCTVDDAYNAGIYNAIKLINQCGITSKSEPVQAIKDFSAARLSMYHHFSNWARYGAAWGGRIGRIEGKSLRLCANTPPAVIKAHSDKIQADAKNHVAKATTAAGATVGTHFTPISGVFLYILIAILILAFIAFAINAIANNARAKGLLEAINA